MAYLLPIVQSLRAQELMALGNVTNDALRAEALSKLRRPRRPRAIILAPTRELVAQCVSMMTAMAKFTDLRAALIVGGGTRVQGIERHTRGG